MRSATLLAFVDWRPSAVNSTILVSAAGRGLALELGDGASLGDGAPEEPCLYQQSTHVRGQPCRLQGRGFRPRSAPAKAAPTSLRRFRPLVWGSLSRIASGYERPRIPCFGRIRGINHS